MKSESENLSKLNKSDLENEIKSGYDNIDTPPHLWSRVQRTAADQKSMFRRQRKTHDSYSGFGGFRLFPALAVTCSLLVVATLGFFKIMPSSNTQDVQEVADAQAALPAVLTSEFATFIASGRNLDVDSTSVDDLTRWFASRLERPRPPQPPVTSTLRLAGGRLCNIQGKRIAAYMYQLNKMQVALYVTNQADTAKDSEQAGPPLSVSTHDDVAYASWQQLGWRYSLVGALNSKALTEIAAQLSKALQEQNDARVI